LNGARFWSLSISSMFLRSNQTNEEDLHTESCTGRLGQFITSFLLCHDYPGPQMTSLVKSHSYPIGPVVSHICQTPRVRNEEKTGHHMLWRCACLRCAKCTIPRQDPPMPTCEMWDVQNCCCWRKEGTSRRKIIPSMREIRFVLDSVSRPGIERVLENPSNSSIDEGGMRTISRALLEISEVVSIRTSTTIFRDQGWPPVIAWNSLGCLGERHC